MSNMKRLSRTVRVGNLEIGGSNPIAVQSMTNIDTADISAVTEQLKVLKSAGCHIVRFAVNSMEAVKAIPVYKTVTDMPLVADIHFDYRLALAAADAGIDKIRINPGNIGDMDRVKAVADACANKNIPIRIGVNSGSVEKKLLEKYGGPTPEAMVESAMEHVKMLNRYDFDDIVISIKSSNVKNMIEAYRKMAETADYPLHLGVTEAGTERMGIIKSSIGIGSLLADGIGETIRVSLTGDPVREVYAARDILKSLGLRDGVEFVSCPTCGRTRIDLIKLANDVEKALEDVHKNIKVAVMGCVVNGPGEAREADIGVAGGDGCAVIFKKGEVVRKVSEENILSELLKEIDNL